MISIKTKLALLIDKVIESIDTTFKFTVPVREWAQNPLKKAVDKKVEKLYTWVFKTPEYRVLNDKEKKVFVKQINKKISNKKYIDVDLEKSTTGKVRRVKTWDQYYLESYYAKQLGVTVPMHRMSNKLANHRYCYYMSMDSVEFTLFVPSSVDEEQIIKRYKEYCGYLIEPAYRLQRFNPQTEMYVGVYQKSGKKYNLAFKEEYIPDLWDFRIDTAKIDKETGLRMGGKGKIPITNNQEGVHDYDEELRPEKYFFSDYAVALVEADHRYNGDTVQATKDLKDYYYSRPEVMSHLMSQYDKGVFQNPHAEPVGFEKFIEIVKSYDEPIVEKYPLEDILEGFTSSTAPQNKSKGEQYA